MHASRLAFAAWAVCFMLFGHAATRFQLQTWSQPRADSTMTDVAGPVASPSHVQTQGENVASSKASSSSIAPSMGAFTFSGRKPITEPHRLRSTSVTQTTWTRSVATPRKRHQRGRFIDTHFDHQQQRREQSRLRWRLVSFVDHSINFVDSSMVSPGAVNCSAQMPGLQELYHALNGQGWFNNSGWLSDEPLPLWRGVHNVDSNCTFQLDLSHNNVSGTLPPSFPGSIPGLHSFTVVDGHLSGTFPPGLSSDTGALSQLVLDNVRMSGTLPSKLPRTLSSLLLANISLSGTLPALEAATLQSLELRRLYGVSGTVPDLMQLQNLTRLYLIDTPGLHGTLPASLYQMSTLQSLALLFNQISGSLSQNISQLINLERLEIEAMPLVGTIPEAITQLQNLKVLYLNSLSCSGRIPPDWSKWRSMEHLDISDLQGVTGSIPASVAGMGNLAKISVFNLPLLTGTLPPEFLSLPHLYELNIYSNPGLSGTIPHGFFQTQSIREVYFGGQGRLSGTFPASIAAQVEVIEFAGNAISGTLDAMCNAPTLKKLYLENLPQLSGSFPSCLGSLTLLEKLDVINTPLISGTLPTDLTALKYLGNFNVQGQPLVSGAIPTMTGLGHLQSVTLDAITLRGNLSSFTDVPNLISLVLHNIDLSGEFPNSTSWSLLETLILTNNRVSGTVPLWVCQQPLTVLSVGSNLISGLLPACEMANLEVLDISQNLFSSLPLGLLRSPALREADVSANNITFDADGGCLSFSDLALGSLDLSDNPLHTHIHNIYSCLLTQQLTSLSVRNCALYGEFDSPIPVLDLSGEKVYNGISNFRRTLYLRGHGQPFQLTSLDISMNKISGYFVGPFFPYPPWHARRINYFPVLTRVSISHTDLHVQDVGISPIFREFDASFVNSISVCALYTLFTSIPLSSLQVVGVPIDMSAQCIDKPLSHFISTTERTIFNATTKVECPEWSTLSGALIETDTLFNQHTDCTCPDNFIWSCVHEGCSAGMCIPCPDTHIICNASVVNPLHGVASDYYPIFPLSCPRSSPCLLASALVECRRLDVCALTFSQHADHDNVQLVPRYICAEGYDVASNLCSQCSDGYFAVRHACLPCTSWLSSFAFITIILGIALYSVFVWRQFVRMNEVASFSITVFWLQMVTVVNHTQHSIYPHGWIADFAALQPWGIECLWRSTAQHSLEVFLTLPVVLPALTALLFCIWGAKQHILGTEPFKERLVFGVLYTTELLYLPMCVTVFSSLNCEHVTVDYDDTHVSFLSRVPYRDCGDAGLTALAMFTLLYLVIAWPVYSSYRVWHAPATATFNFIAKPVHNWWWQAIVLRARSALITLFQYALPFRSSFALVCTFATLVVNLILQVHFKPYKRSTDNWLSVFTLLSLLVTFLSTIISRDSTVSDLATDVFQVLLFFATFVACVVGVVRTGFGDVISRARRYTVDAMSERRRKTAPAAPLLDETYGLPDHSRDSINSVEP